VSEVWSARCEVRAVKCEGSSVKPVEEGTRGGGHVGW